MTYKKFTFPITFEISVACETAEQAGEARLKLDNNLSNELYNYDLDAVLLCWDTRVGKVSEPQELTLEEIKEYELYEEEEDFTCQQCGVDVIHPESICSLCEEQNKENS